MPEPKENIAYKGMKIFVYDNEFQKVHNLKILKNNDWQTFFYGKDGYYLQFYPFSEYHGGGRAYIICLGNKKPESFLVENPDFEDEVRAIIQQS